MPLKDDRTVRVRNSASQLKLRGQKRTFKFKQGPRETWYIAKTWGENLGSPAFPVSRKKEVDVQENPKTTGRYPNTLRLKKTPY